jgi:hypothetical protein
MTQSIPQTLPELITQLMGLADLYANAVAANVDDDAPNMHELEQAEEAARSDLAEALESALAAQPLVGVIPEGMALVPKLSNAVMNDAGLAVLKRRLSVFGLTRAPIWSDAEACHAAMVAAAKEQS